MTLQVHLVGQGIDWPAWVQAVGSVGAIFVAWWLTRRQLLHAEQQRLRERHQARLDRLEPIVALADIARRLVDDVEWNATYFRERYSRTAIDHLILRLLEVPVHDLPDAELVEQVVLLPRYLRWAKDAIGRAYDKECAELNLGKAKHEAAFKSHRTMVRRACAIIDERIVPMRRALQVGHPKQASKSGLPNCVVSDSD